MLFNAIFYQQQTINCQSTVLNNKKKKKASLLCYKAGKKFKTSYKEALM